MRFAVCLVSLILWPQVVPVKKMKADEISSLLDSLGFYKRSQKGEEVPEEFKHFPLNAPRDELWPPLVSTGTAARRQWRAESQRLSRPDSAPTHRWLDAVLITHIYNKLITSWACVASFRCVSLKCMSLWFSQRKAITQQTHERWPLKKIGVAEAVRINEKPNCWVLHF